MHKRGYKSSFTRAVEKAVKAIPSGRVASYGQIALLVGMPRAAQAVGQILHILGESAPWYRVVNRHGHLVTKCGYHTFLDQKKALENEGLVVAEINGIYTVSMTKFQWVNSDLDLKQFVLGHKSPLNQKIKLY